VAAIQEIEMGCSPFCETTQERCKTPKEGELKERTPLTSEKMITKTQQKS
jgi:hypothetical protein